MSSYLLALLAALSFALGSVFQQRGTLQTSAKEGDSRFLLEILHKPVWLMGGLFQVSGWTLQAAALDRGSLVVVQSLCALSLVLALPLGVKFTGQQVGRRSIIGAGATFVGIVAFLGLGQPQGGISQPETSAWWACGLTIVAIMFLLSGLARRRRGAIAAALFATAAGIGFGFQAAVTKVFVDLIGNGLGVILTSWTTYALIISALAGFALQQSALKTSFLAPAMAASNAASLATSVFLGVILFEETISKGQGRLPPALFALALAIFGVILLAYPQNRLSEDIAK
jgi:drug/metabolite transporter (DMT)-like permease